tara:strand:+ start:286 stop:504 length:219 start_codon:yes stop_codon:yes gene_type:complete
MKAHIKKLGYDVVHLQLKLKFTEITESFFRQEVRKLAEDYAKLKVIEELEKAKTTKSWFYVNDRIQELKQER